MISAKVLNRKSLCCWLLAPAHSGWGAGLALQMSIGKVALLSADDFCEGMKRFEELLPDRRLRLRAPLCRSARTLLQAWLRTQAWWPGARFGRRSSAFFAAGCDYRSRGLRCFLRHKHAERREDQQRCRNHGEAAPRTRRESTHDLAGGDIHSAYLAMRNPMCCALPSAWSRQASRSSATLALRQLEPRTTCCCVPVAGPNGSVLAGSSSGYTVRNPGPTRSRFRPCRKGRVGLPENVPPGRWSRIRPRSSQPQYC